MNVINRLRMARGLRWQADMPRAVELGIDLQNMLIIAIIVMAYMLVGSIDAATEKRIEAEKQAARGDMHRNALLACVNGGMPGLYTTDADGNRHYVACGESFTISDENVKRKGRS